MGDGESSTPRTPDSLGPSVRSGVGFPSGPEVNRRDDRGGIWNEERWNWSIGLQLNYELDRTLF